MAIAHVWEEEGAFFWEGARPGDGAQASDGAAAATAGPFRTLLNAILHVQDLIGADVELVEGKPERQLAEAAGPRV